MGELIGGVIGMALVTIIIRLLTKRFMSGYKLAIVTVAIAYVVSCILMAFGSADGGPPQWTAGVLPYGIGGLVVLAVWIWKIRQEGLDVDG
ncbi:MAG: hypothetical protein ACO1OD_02490 [Croceibacterium sp.]